MKQGKITQSFLNVDFRIILNPTLELDAEGIYKTAETWPLAGQSFYILERSAEEILKENREAIWDEVLKKVDSECSDPDNVLANQDKIRGKKIKRYLQFYSDAFNSPKYSVVLKHTAESASSFAPLINAAYAKAIDVLKNRAVKTFTTDPEGKAKIKTLKASTYYICGVCKTPWETRVWNIRIDLKPGENSMLLDNKIWQEQS